MGLLGGPFKSPNRSDSTFYAGLVLHDIERYSMVLHDIASELTEVHRKRAERVAPGHMSG